MRLRILTAAPCAAALCAAAPAAHAIDLGPLAPAADGKVQCYSPNAAAKSCQSIGAYQVDAKGVIQNDAVVMINSSPLLVMTTRSAVTLKGGADCGVLRPEHIAGATFTVEGRPADAGQTARLRGAMLGTMKPMLGHEICVYYRAQGDGVLATSTIDGKPQPQMDQHVMWVSPAEGWRVGF